MIKKMSGKDKKVMKKGTKLSLTKKTSKTEVSSSHKKNGMRNILDGGVDLNETCEFQNAVQFSGCTDRNAQAEIVNIGKTVMKANKSEVSEKTCTKSKETVRCQVCNKNLSHMTVQRREQHVNKCIDEVEVIERQQQAEKQVLEAARIAVLDCPMCGKHFKAENSRTVHLKRCCQELGVSTEKMIQLVKEQEQDRQKQVAVGIVPQQLRSKVTKLVAPKKRKLKEPKSQFEEDVQVAMAMSSSLSSTGDNINTGKRKKSKKAVLEDVCLLTTLTDEDRQRRIEEKVSNVLHMANHTNDSYNMVLEESTLKTGSLENNLTLWEKCSQDPVTCDSEQFYVGALIPPLSVSKSIPGKNLERLPSIPGRDKSLIKNDTPLKDKTSDEGTDDIITASTQTAVVLAELAVDDTNILDVTDLQKADNMVDLQASGFCMEELVLNREFTRSKSYFLHGMKCDLEKQVTQTLLDYRRMVNNKEYSDITVSSSSGQTFYAHQVILAARCPTLLQMMKDSVITLDINPDNLLIFLTFMYTGDITLTSSSQNELLKLANQLEFTPLVDACNKVVLQEEISDSVNLNDNQESSDTNFGESKVDMKEIWGESDSDLDLTEGEETADKEISSESDINDNDYREISCTQHRKLRDRLSQSFTDIMKSDDISNVLGDFPVGDQNELINKGNELEDECVSVYSESTDVNNDNEAMDVDFNKENDHNEKDKDSDTSPNPKKIRLISDTELVNDKEMAETDESKFDVDGENTVDYKGCNQSCKQVNEVIEIDEDIANNTTIGVNDTTTGMNSSTADLFDSPSPRRANVTETVVKEANKTLFSQNEENKSNFSTRLENRFTFSRSLNTIELPETGVVEIDSDSTQGDMDKVCDVGNINDENQEDKSCGLNECDTENDKDGKDSEAVHSFKMDQDVSDDDGCKSENNAADSDDDLQITGDNLDDFIQNSPTFHHKTVSSVKKVNYSEKGFLETKYLGIQSFSKGISDPSLDSDNEETIELLTEDSNVSGERSDNTDNVSVPNVKQSCIEKNQERCVREYERKGSPEKNGRVCESKSKAYGKHEVSLYTDDTEDVDTPNSSFKADNADVWEDFDDCGMGYEPPEFSVGSVSDYQPQIRGPGQDSTLTECEQSAESPGELSPVIPMQEVIDLSQHEDESDITEKQQTNDIDDALLEDGEDSFVFKVSDEQQGRETPATKNQSSKKGSFKTPTVIAEKHGKKNWEPPSPFTPMPQYGSMSTPALKKAVQKYGVKPVGKKRMVKVLEDIYHQTHQYETDSECEEEIHTAMPVFGGGGDTVISDSPPSSQGDLSSQDSDISEVLEESCLHMSSDSDTTSSPQKNVDVPKQLFQFIKTRPEIHAKILMYEPLELDVLKKDVKDSGIKCSMDKLMDFLDERCIAFTSKNSRNRQASRRGKQKAAKSKQNDMQSEK